MIGHRFMGEAHSNAWRQVARFFETPFEPVLKVVFLPAVDEGRAPSPSFEDGVKNQRVLGAVERAAASRSWEKV